MVRVRSTAAYVPAALSAAVATARELVLVAAPQGLQGGARRNAWRALVDDSARARDRAEAAAAMGLALAAVRPDLGRAAGA